MIKKSKCLTLLFASSLCFCITDFLNSQVQDCKQTEQYVYWRLDTPLTWNNAFAACEGVERGHLVSIHDFDENHIVTALKDARSDQYGIYVWIGLHCTGTCSSSQIVWTDETPMDYSKNVRLDISSSCAAVIEYQLKDRINDNGLYDQDIWYGRACDELYLSICKARIQ